VDSLWLSFALRLNLKKLRLWKLLDFVLNFVLFQTCCKINLSFFCLIKLCFFSKRRCILFFSNKTIIAEEEADNPLQCYNLNYLSKTYKIHKYHKLLSYWVMILLWYCYDIVMLFILILIFISLMFIYKKKLCTEFALYFL
jgi:hypothetical protein